MFISPNDTSEQKMRIPLTINLKCHQGNWTFLFFFSRNKRLGFGQVRTHASVRRKDIFLRNTKHPFKKVLVSLQPRNESVAS